MGTVQVWDRGMVGAVERAIRESGLGLNPASDGQLVRVPIPALSEERRVELTKIAGKYAEQGRIAVRNVRRDGMEMLKKMEKDYDISKDEHHHWSEQIQQLTDKHIKRSEEHTSELQSLMRISYAVFCLKKKKTTHTIITTRSHTYRIRI